MSPWLDCSGGWARHLPCPAEDELLKSGGGGVHESRRLGSSSGRDVGPAHVGVDRFVGAQLAGFRVPDAADTTTLALDVEIDLQRRMAPERWLVYHVDVNLAGTSAPNLNAPLFAARPLAFAWGACDRDKNYIAGRNLCLVRARLHGSRFGCLPGRSPALG